MRYSSTMQVIGLSRGIEHSAIEPRAARSVKNGVRDLVRVLSCHPQVSKILVPVDFSTASLGAVRYASVLSRRFQASVCLLHVVPFDAFTQSLCRLGFIARYNEAVRKRERLLEKLIRAAAAPAPQWETCLRVGDPAQEIVTTAKIRGMDLIILSIDGSSAVKHPLVSGITERVVRRQPCLTLTLRRELLAPDKITQTSAWKNILVPVDLSEASRLTVRWAAGFAEQLNAKMTIRYAPALLEENRCLKMNPSSHMQARAFGVKEIQWATWANLGAVGAVEVDLLPELEGPDAHVLGRMLRRAGSDLIVMGMTRPSWWHRLMHGGVAEQLRRVAPCPVLNVPQHEWEYEEEEITT
jgi:nucleotide-binding universal stress UspA family protein